MPYSDHAVLLKATARPSLDGHDVLAAIVGSNPAGNMNACLF